MRALEGKNALVTGGTRGIGRATAMKLAGAGCNVAVLYYNSHAEAETICSEIQAEGGRALAIQADVGNPDSLKEAFLELANAFPKLDIVVSNAATGVLRPAMQLTLKHWRKVTETNSLALLTLAQLASPMMPNGGRIVAISSLGSIRAIPQYAFIGASKAALESLARSLAQELGPLGIRVNVVNAGAVDTDALKHFPNRDALLEEHARRAPAGPVLTPQDVANGVYLLCLPEAEMITGHTLMVDGGYAISG